MKINLKSIESKLRKAYSQEKSTPVHLANTYSDIDILKVIEKKNRDYVFYGEDNLAPLRLKELLNGSPVHSAIIKTKTLMTAGDGLLLNGAKSQEESQDIYDKLDVKTRAEYDFLIKNPFGQQDFYTFLDKIAFDYNEYGAICYEIVWNKDFNKVASYNHIPIPEIRAAKMIGGKIPNYFRSDDWTCRTPDYKPYYPVNINNKENVNQIVYHKKGGLTYYGEPDYSGAILWIQIDYNMGMFHLANIENGMNPGLHWKFYTVPASDNEKQDILDDIKRNYKGAKKAGNSIATFSASKELQTEIQPIESSTLDKQLIHLAELCDKKILSGHQLTSPMLAGITTSGQFSGGTELEISYRLYDNMVMEKSRNDVINNINKYIFNVNIPKLKVDINPFNPLKEKLLVKQDKGTLDALASLGPLVANKVLESMSPEEIRGLIGLKGTFKPNVNG